MKLFMKLTSMGAVLLMGWIAVRAMSGAAMSCQSANSLAVILYTNTLSVLWGAIMVLTLWLHVQLDRAAEQPR